MTGARAAEVETRSGELDIPDPVTLASDDVQMHIRAIKAAQEKKDTAVQLLNGCYKQAKKLNKHLPDAIRKAITAERADDHYDLRQSLEVLGIALRETGSPVQLHVHDTLLGDVTEAAYKRGRKDAELGKFSSSPYPAGSDLEKSYKEGWGGVTAARVIGAGGKWPGDEQVEAGKPGDPEEWPENGKTELREEVVAH